MKYLDHACGLRQVSYNMKENGFINNFYYFRLKTAAKVIAIAGMVLSVIGFSVAVDRLTKMKIATKSKISNDTKVIEEEFLIDNREAINGHSESGSGEVTTFPPGVQDITASVEKHQTEEDDGAGEAEVLLPLAGGQHDDGTSNGDAESRSRRSIEDNKGSGDTEDNVPSTSPNLALEYETETVIYDDETLITVATGSAPTPTPRTESSSTTISSFTTEKEHLSTTTTSEEFDEYEDVPDVEDHSNDSTEDGVHHDDIHSGDSEVSEGTEDNQTEKLQQEDTETSGDGDDSETVSANEEDHEDGFGPSIASQVVTGLGVPITLLGLVSNAILLHSAKKVIFLIFKLLFLNNFDYFQAEKKLIIVWFVWAVVLYMYQVFAMIVNITDLSVYVFLNLALFILSVGAGYVVLSYR